MKGAAWAAPAVFAASAAPAFAQSPVCEDEDVELNWGFVDYQGKPSLRSNFTTTVTFLPQNIGEHFPEELNTPLTASIYHSYHGYVEGGSDSPTQFNGRITTYHVGGIGQVGYEVYQQTGRWGERNPGPSDYQQVRFTFSEELTNLRFSITDIDRRWANNGVRDYIDGVSLTSGTPFQYSRPNGSTVTGAGTHANPWRNSENRDYNEDRAGGQIDIQFTQPVTTFTIRYRNLSQTAPWNAHNDQTIFVTGFMTNRPIACV